MAIRTASSGKFANGPPPGVEDDMLALVQAIRDSQTNLEARHGALEQSVAHLSSICQTDRPGPVTVLTTIAPYPGYPGVAPTTLAPYPVAAPTTLAPYPGYPLAAPVPVKRSLSVSSLSGTAMTCLPTRIVPASEIASARTVVQQEVVRLPSMPAVQRSFSVPSVGPLIMKSGSVTMLPCSGSVATSYQTVPLTASYTTAYAPTTSAGSVSIPMLTATDCSVAPSGAGSVNVPVSLRDCGPARLLSTGLAPSSLGSVSVQPGVQVVAAQASPSAGSVSFPVGVSGATMQIPRMMSDASMLSQIHNVSGMASGFGAPLMSARVAAPAHFFNPPQGMPQQAMGMGFGSHQQAAAPFGSNMWAQQQMTVDIPAYALPGLANTYGQRFTHARPGSSPTAAQAEANAWSYMASDYSQPPMTTSYLKPVCTQLFPFTTGAVSL